MSLLLALDIEGTIKIATLIDPDLKALLSSLHTQGWIIVLASSAYGSKLNEYKKLFIDADIDQFIDNYFPLGDEPQDTKCQKLEKYRAQYGIQSKTQVYFFDDLLSHILEAKLNGYVNSFHVSQKTPLSKYLRNI